MHKINPARGWKAARYRRRDLLKKHIGHKAGKEGKNMMYQVMRNTTTAGIRHHYSSSRRAFGTVWYSEKDDPYDDPDDDEIDDEDDDE